MMNDIALRSPSFGRRLLGRFFGWRPSEETILPALTAHFESMESRLSRLEESAESTAQSQRQFRKALLALEEASARLEKAALANDAVRATFTQALERSDPGLAAFAMYEKARALSFSALSPCRPNETPDPSLPAELARVESLLAREKALAPLDDLMRQHGLRATGVPLTPFDSALHACEAVRCVDPQVYEAVIALLRRRGALSSEGEAPSGLVDEEIRLGLQRRDPATGLFHLLFPARVTVLLPART